MKRRPLTLSATFVRQVREPGVYGDGRGGYGLSLLVKPMANGRISKSWCQRIRIDGKPYNIGLGAFPLITLAEARAEALENARTARAGKHPRKSVVPTFEAAAEKVIEIHRPTWTDPKSEADWTRTLRYAFPVFGRKRVDEITTSDVLKVLVPIWQTKHSTAKRVRQRIGAVMDWCESHGHRSGGSNPAGNAITAALPAPARNVKNYPALPYAEVADAIARVRASSAWSATKRLFEFMVLTAARSGEARGATWSEIDFETRMWTVPAERVKARKEHRVPLSARAVEILREAQADTGGSRLVFPSNVGKPLVDATLSRLLHKLGIEAVPHGFRSSFRDWASERTNVQEAVCEAALAHVRGDQTVAAYARSDLFDRRRDLMERWARYLEAGTAEVVSLDARRA